LSPRVTLQPIDEAIDCAPEETVLDAAFRQGYNLAYGCREGQCSACKCFLVEGEVALKPYSTFALSESEESNGYTLMCRAMPEQDLVVELLHYDPEAYRLEHPIRDGRAEVVAVEALTHDITRLHLKVIEPEDFAFKPGQYVDLHVPVLLFLQIRAALGALHVMRFALGVPALAIEFGAHFLDQFRVLLREVLVLVAAGSFLSVPRSHKSL
jgi:ferredoxin